MKRKNIRFKLIAGLSLSILLTAAVLWRILSLHYASFEELVLDYIRETDTYYMIDITKRTEDYDKFERVEITDQGEIQELISHFSTMKFESASDASLPWDYYLVRIQLKTGAHFDMTLYEEQEQYIRIDNSRRSAHKYHAGEFKISNGFDTAILEQYFK